MKRNPEKLLKQKLGPRVAVVGDGKSGQSAYRLLKEFGGVWQALDLFARHEEILRGEGESAGFIRAYDSLIVSPGIPLSYFWSAAEREGIRLWNEIDVASLFLEDEKIVAITGSAGKSTCTDGLGYVLRSLGTSTFVGGNIGRPFCDYVTDFVLRGQRVSFIVLELSSYHLENLHHLQCHFSAITSLFPNHLERYPSLEEYYVTKFFFLLLSKQALYLNRQGGALETYVQLWAEQPEQAWSLWVAHTSTTIRQALKRLGSNANEQIENLRQKLWELLRWVHSADLSQFGTGEYRLIGEHNRQNLALIMRLAEALGLPRESVVQTLSEYSGLPHRLEYVGEFGGYHWVNDSKATTIASVNEAIQSLKPALNGAQLHVLLGGRDKNLDWESLSRWRGDAQVKFVFFGECADLAKQKSELDGPLYSRLSIALEALKTHLKVSDWVTLSPGGSSLDEFRSFEERGDFFKNWIKSSV